MKSRTLGFTLIELAIGIALIALIAAAGVPLTTAWVDQSRASEAVGQIRLGYSKARALALRGQDEVFLCLNDGTIYLYGANPGTCGSTNPAPVWRAGLAGGSATIVRLGEGGNNSPLASCFGFSRKGWLNGAAQIGNSTCAPANTTQITASKGSKSVSKNLL